MLEEKEEELGEPSGMIDFPCGCSAKILVYEGSAGKISTPCPICRKYALFYTEQMTAKVVGPARGAVKKIKLRGLSPSRLGP